ncbi:hypothetical protein [Flectobacillus rivi]|uniref:Capsule assembly Wzi family protein n=1 Tax=Flectobacillus rivi TaxID=2984209 RepID=A0ABT6Z242_9BACT|nr:hypothetical protein [Flectobacillus rivi]MDI9875193.1 hypothetical protein [Flectobacillus rivi]
MQALLMFSKRLLGIIFLIFTVITSLQAQSVFVPLNADYYDLLDRYEIKYGRFSKTFHTGIKPYTRKDVAQFIEAIDQDTSLHADMIDQFNFNYFKNDNWEWVSEDFGDSHKGIGKYFYKKQADAYSFHNEDIDVHINPVMNVQIGSIAGGNQSYYSLNTRGIEIRGIINNRIGFYTYMTDNISRVPDYIKDYADSFNQNIPTSPIPIAGMPGEGLTKYFKQDLLTTDFFSARAYLTFQASKNISIQFGHDKNIIGNGFRSMILSDNSAPYLFLKLTTQIGAFQYQNLFTELINPGRIPPDQIFPKKYMAMHHLSVNLSSKLNIGFTESVIFKRDSTNGVGGFELNYLNPVIFYRFVESFQGSGDNALVGLDFKYNFAKKFSLYGQFMLDEFIIKEIFSNSGSWTNKYGAQVGVKYIDILGIKHLDFQGEYNMARPYTYSHSKTGLSYSHYNQALAHPLGANFSELTSTLRAQPFSKLQLVSRAIFANYGEDSNGSNWGKNILLDYNTRSRLAYYNDNNGNTLGQGVASQHLTFDIRASYQFKHNFFVDLHYLRRDFKSQQSNLNNVTNLLSIGLRWNTADRGQYY